MADNLGKICRITPCRSRMHGRNLFFVSTSPVSCGLILTGCFLLLLRHEKSPGVAVSNAHAFAQRSQFRVVFLVAPDLHEGFAVLKLEIVVLRQSARVST